MSAQLVLAIFTIVAILAIVILGFCLLALIVGMDKIIEALENFDEWFKQL